MFPSPADAPALSLSAQVAFDIIDSSLSGSGDTTFLWFLESLPYLLLLACSLPPTSEGQHLIGLLCLYASSGGSQLE